MLSRPNVKKIGFILKTHGNKGKLKVKIDETARFPVNIKGTIFFEIHKKMVPFTIIGYELLSENIMILETEELNDISNAENYIGLNVFYLQNEELTDNEHFDPDKIIGFELFDQNNHFVGRVSEIIINKESVLLEINENDLIPFHEDFLMDYNFKDKILVLKLPDGILSINK